jgi:MSHA biogenesis protein MshL
MKGHYMKRIYLSLMVVGLAGCQSLPAYWGENTQGRIRSDIAAARDTDSLKNTGIPAEITKALLPPVSMGLSAANTDVRETRFDLSVRNSRARDVYLGLVKDTPYSVVVEKGVNAKISLNLKNVTLEEAFDSIRETYGYDYEKRDNKYLIFSDRLRSRIFNVNYINVNRVGGSTTNISSGGLTEDTVNANVQTKSEVDFWKTFKESMESIIGKEDGRGVIINPQSGLVVVTATNHELRLVEEFIRDTHDAIGRQVILEAKILEVELNDGFQTGINWGRLIDAAGNIITLGQIGGGTLSGVDAVSGLADQGTSDIINDAVPNTSTTGFGGMFSVALQRSNFGAFIEMIQTQGDVQVLSSPRVATVNNQKAVIKVGGDEFFITGVTAGSENQNNNSGNQDAGSTVEMEAFFSGIALDVTPQIDKHGEIILHLHPTVSEVAQRNKSFVVDGKSFNLPLAASTVRETDNIVKAQSGQIIVVGGLMKEQTVERNSMVPILGKIPLLGILFRHQKVSRVKKELIVLVKPTVIDNVAAWNVEAKSTLDRFAELER